MTLAKRIEIVRTLTIIQMVIPLFFLAGGLAFGVFVLLGNPGELPPIPFIGFGLLLGLVATAITIGLPWVVLTALKKRQENWAIAAFVVLIIQIVGGGGFFSILPILSLVLLLNKEASAYIGMK